MACERRVYLTHRAQLGGWLISFDVVMSLLLLAYRCGWESHQQGCETVSISVWDQTSLVSPLFAQLSLSDYRILSANGNATQKQMSFKETRNKRTECPFFVIPASKPGGRNHH